MYLNLLVANLISLIAFKQILQKILAAAYIFSYTVINNLKKLIETKSCNTKQCEAGLSPGIIPHYPPKPLWETVGIGENPS